MIAEPEQAKTVIHLEGIDGAPICTLPAYPDLYSVPLANYIDFLRAREPLDDPRAISEGTVNEALVLAKAVGYFFGIDIHEVLKAKFGPYDENAGALKNLQTLYVWIIALVGTFKGRIRTPEDCWFDYDGERYTIPIIGLQALASLPLLPALETGEVIEAYEIQRVSQAAIQKGDKDGSHLYGYYLRLLAVLCRKDGEKLPVFDDQVQVFIDNRASHFKRLDAGTALDIDFFLASLMQPSEVTKASIGSLVNPAFDLVHQIQKPRRRSVRRSFGRSKGRVKFSMKSDGAKPTSKSSHAGGSGTRNKRKSKQ